MGPSTIRCAMMDDVEIAVSQLTELGRRVVAPSASVIRNTMLMFAAANHWPVIVHSEFAKWALDQAKSDETCLILDPLMYVDGAKARLKRIRRSRILTRRLKTASSR